MYITIDENNYITTASWGGILEEGFEIQDFEFTEDIRAYKCIDGEIVLDHTKLEQLSSEYPSQEEVKNLQKYLHSTDYIALQWLEEEKLNIPHHKSNEEYQEVIQKRQEAREKIREMSN